MLRILVSHWICHYENRQILPFPATSIFLHIFIMEGKIDLGQFHSEMMEGLFCMVISCILSDLSKLYLDYHPQEIMQFAMLLFGFSAILAGFSLYIEVCSISVNMGEKIK